MIFRRINSLLASHPTGDQFAIMLRRLCELYQLKSIEEIHELKSDKSPAFRAALLADRVNENFKTLTRDLSDRPNLTADELRFSRLISSVKNGACQMGFLLAKAEFDAGPRRLAEVGREVAEGGREGGEKLGPARRKAASDYDSKIEPVVLDLVKGLQNDEGELSRKNEAFAVQEQWKGKPKPGLGKLERIIVKLENAGLLPSRRHNRQRPDPPKN
jgi:hypothetical protein